MSTIYNIYSFSRKTANQIITQIKQQIPYQRMTQPSLAEPNKIRVCFASTSSKLLGSAGINQNKRMPEHGAYPRSRVPLTSRTKAFGGGEAIPRKSSSPSRERGLEEDSPFPAPQAQPIAEQSRNQPRLGPGSLSRAAPAVRECGPGRAGLG